MRGREGEASEEVAGAPVFYQIIERWGGVFEEEAREGEGRWGHVCGEGGGAAKYFFWGPKCPPSLGVKFPGPFFAGNCAEKPLSWVPVCG